MSVNSSIPGAVITWASNTSKVPEEFFTWNGAIDGSLPNSSGTIFTTTTTATGYIEVFFGPKDPPPDEPHVIQELI